MTHERQGGFSLIELLVAMTITLIVSGAIYGLLTGGQSAFRREPELTERQQNIRLAMDMIMRDTANAGVSLPPFAQIFTTGLDDDGASPIGPSGARSDQIEMLASGGQESEGVCADLGNGGTDAADEETLYLTRKFAPLFVPAGGDPRLVFVVFSSDRTTAADDFWTSRRITAQGQEPYPAGTSGPTPPDCDAATLHATLTFDDGTPGNDDTICAPAPGPGWPAGNVPTGLACNTLAVTRVVFGNQVRYRIRNDPADGVPVLQRSSTEDPNTFQTLARGIEELQVQYTQVADPDTWLDDAPLVSAPDDTPPVPDTNYGTLINQVRVTLTSRSEARNIQGAMNNAGGTDPRLRGSLTSTSAPRAALMHVVRARPSPMPSPGTWYWE